MTRRDKSHDAAILDVADGDVLVADPSGAVTRPIYNVLQDQYSGKILSWRVVPYNGQAKPIERAFRDLSSVTP